LISFDFWEYHVAFSGFVAGMQQADFQYCQLCPCVMLHNVKLLEYWSQK